MKIYNYVKIDMDTGKTIEEDSFEYYGSLALCYETEDTEEGGGYGGSSASGADPDDTSGTGMSDSDYASAMADITGKTGQFDPTETNVMGTGPSGGQPGVGPEFGGGYWSGGDLAGAKDVMGKTNTWQNAAKTVGSALLGPAALATNLRGDWNVQDKALGKMNPALTQSGRNTLQTDVRSGWSDNMPNIDPSYGTDPYYPKETASALTIAGAGTGAGTGTSTALDSGTGTGTATTSSGNEATDFIDRTYAGREEFERARATNPNWTEEKWARAHYEKTKDEPGVYWGLTKEEEETEEGEEKKLSDTFKNPYFKFFGESALQKPGYMDSIMPDFRTSLNRRRPSRM